MLDSWQQPERPTLSHAYGASRAELLAAEAADTFAVTDLQFFTLAFDRTLRAVSLADAALDT